MQEQPVHTVVGGAHLFRRDTAAKLGRIAGRYLDRYAADPAALREALGTRLPSGTAEAVHRRVRAKLEREPVESFLIDFEDGFGARSEAEEDEAAALAAAEVAAGAAAGSLPPSLGIRIKSLSEVTGERALRTLERFLAALVRTGRNLPDGFTVLLPKVVAAGQVARLAGALDRLETTLGLPEKRVAIDLMIETPQSLVAPDGRIAVPGLVAAADGRCRTVHLGAYDLTGAAAVAAEDQTLGHPLCDVARQLLQLSLAGTGVQLSDGATNVLPVEPHRGESRRLAGRAGRKQGCRARRLAPALRRCAAVSEPGVLPELGPPPGSARLPLRSRLLLLPRRTGRGGEPARPLRGRRGTGRPDGIGVRR